MVFYYSCLMINKYEDKKYPYCTYFDQSEQLELFHARKELLPLVIRLLCHYESNYFAFLLFSLVAHHAMISTVSFSWQHCPK